MGRRPKGYPSSRVGAFLNLHVVLGKLAVPDGTAPEHGTGDWGRGVLLGDNMPGFLFFEHSMSSEEAPQMSNSPQ